jgi:hypothetical protein
MNLNMEVQRMSARRVVVITLAVLVSPVLCAGESAQEIVVRSTHELRGALRNVRPGTHVVIAPGVYQASGGSKVAWIANVKGTAESPVVFRAQDPNDRPIFRGGNECWHMKGCSYVVVDGVICEGADVNNFQFDFSDHFVVKNCVTRKMTSKANGGNCDGIKMPGDRDFLIYNCVIETWGSGGSAIDMVGCANGLIARCTFRFPTKTGSANATQPKCGTQDIGIYKNLFDHASLRAMQFGGAGKPMHLGAEKKMSGLDQFAMGNVILGGEAAVIHACASNTVFAYNTVVNPERYVLRILKEGDYGPMENNLLLRNLIVHERPYLFQQNGPGTRPEAAVWAENYWYCPSHPEASMPKLPVTEKDPDGGRDPKLNEYYVPAKDGPAAAYGAHAAGLDAAWAKHTKHFAWAWEQCQRLEVAREANDADRRPQSAGAG